MNRENKNLDEEWALLSDDLLRQQLGEIEKGTGYFSGIFRGRPRGVRLDTSPNCFAIIVCQSGEPKGAWRLTEVRIRESSWSDKGASSR